MVARSVAGVLVATAAAGLALTGCASAERPAATIEPTSYAGPPIGSVAPAPSANAAPAAPGTSSAPGAPAAASGAQAGKVSATSASEQDIVRALTAAGVSTPDRWADLVVGYRPYPANDPNLTKLRQNLAKDNPPPGVVDKIVSALTP